MVIGRGRLGLDNINLASVIVLPDIQTGKTMFTLGNETINIFDQERTIIDAFRLLSRETAIKALKAAVSKGGKNRIDFVKLQAYAKKLRFNIAPYLMSIMT